MPSPTSARAARTPGQEVSVRLDLLAQQRTLNLVREGRRVNNRGHHEDHRALQQEMNLSAKLPAVGFAIDFDPDRTSFSTVDVRDVSELAASPPR